MENTFAKMRKWENQQIKLKKCTKSCIRVVQKYRPRFRFFVKIAIFDKNIDFSSKFLLSIKIWIYKSLIGLISSDNLVIFKFRNFMFDLKKPFRQY